MEFWNYDAARPIVGDELPHLDARLVNHAVAEADAFRFGCNAVVVGKTVVTNSGCPQLTETLQKAGYQPVAVELDEFLKAGGSAKCLTLRLDGEEAAVWD